MSYMLGIDIGTSGTRSIIVRTDGRVVGSATSEHQPMKMPQPGWAEQDPEDWWRATVESIRTALNGAYVSGEEIAAVGLSGQMHGVVLLDRNSSVLRPALLWCDQRSQPQCEWITSRVGAERLIQLALNPALPGFSAPKLLWVRDNQPEIYAEISRFLLPKDFVRLRLTGEFASDVSDASGTLLLDVANRRWSQDLLTALAIDSAMLPPIFESPEITGQISRESARSTGLRAGTPVVAGGGDQACSGIGNGIVVPGLASATLGTSGVIFSYTDVPKLDPQGRIHTFCHSVPGKWHVMGVTQGAGLSLRWFRENFGAGESWYAQQLDADPYDLIVKESEKVSPGSEGLLFLPYLMGERTPHLDARARGMWFGLTASHNRGHLIRSILEGVAFSLRDSLEIFRELGIPVERVRASGGGSRSQVWRQIQADVYGKELTTLLESSGSAFGAALLAGVGGKVFSSVQDAVSAAVRINERILPQPAHSEIYDHYYQIYKNVYPAVRMLAHGLADLADRT